MPVAIRLYGLAAIVLGVPGLVLRDSRALGMALPAPLIGSAALAVALALYLILAGAALNFRRAAAPAALALTAFFGLRVLALELPRAFAQPDVWVTWEVVAEPLAMALGGLLAFLLLRERRGGRLALAGRIAPLLFGACLVVFGTSELVYAAFTATFVPAWLPPSQLFWAYVTGGCQIAAGLAVLSGVLARLAARLVALMYLVFALIVHLPRVLAAPASAGAWSENGVNLLLVGAAWVLADSLAGQQARR